VSVLIRLLSGFISLSVVVTIVGLIGLVSLAQIQLADKKSYEIGTVSLAKVVNIDESFGTVRTAVRDMFLASDASSRDEAVKRAGVAVDETSEAIAAFSAIVNNEDHSALDIFRKDWDTNLVDIHRMMDLAKTNRIAEGTQVLYSPETSDARNGMINFLSKVIRYDSSYVQSQYTANANLTTSSIVLIAVIMFLALIISIVLGFLISRSIVLPLHTVVKHLGMLSSGDLTVPRKNKHTLRRDELGLLIRTSNALASDLNTSISTIQMTARDLDSISQSLSEKMGNSVAVVAAMGRELLEVKENVLVQSDSVNKTTTTTAKIIRNLENLNDLISEQASNLTQSSSSIEQMFASIRSVTNHVDQLDQTFGDLHISTQDGKEKIGDVVSLIAHVADQSDKLQEANRVIEEIATQTSLLSMNAAIEAAHAGNAGRGFAVVAGEIRKLADRATSQSKEISGNIRSITEHIQLGVSSANSASQAFFNIAEKTDVLGRLSQQIKSAMDEQIVGSKQILEALTQIKQITAEVRDASAQMLEGGKLIGSEMKQVLKGSESVRERTFLLDKGTQEMTEAIDQTRQTNEQTSAQAKKLSEIISQFKIE
jgi:methyl-accepting chemotaxis protein